MKYFYVLLCIVFNIPVLFALDFYQTDSSCWVYPDAPAPEFFLIEPLSTPKNASIPLTFLIRCEYNTDAKVKVHRVISKSGENFSGRIRMYSVKNVPVEANSNNSGTEVGKAPAKPHNVQLVRKAPYEVAEVLIEGASIEIKAGKNVLVLCDIQVRSDCSAGIYNGIVEVSTPKEKIEHTFTFEVHETILPESFALRTSHWLSTDPQDLCYVSAPQFWSKEHWDLIANSAKLLYDFGDRVVTVQTIFSQDPMIQTRINPDGSYDFDFSRFDKFVKIYVNIGYEQIESLALGGHWIGPSDDIYAIEKTSGDRKLLFPKGYCTRELNDYKKQYKWPEYRDRFAQSREYQKKCRELGSFLAVFFDKMYQHIQEKQWTDLYVQQLIDEPRTVRDYAFLSRLARKHLPGIRISNAIHAYGVEDYEKFSEYVDIWIMEANLLRQSKTPGIIEERIRNGRKTGLYVLGKLTAWPNRLLDRPLLDNRIQPWIYYSYGLESYIHWAANRYRGADPYRSSIGPLPGGAQDPGHPVGNNWIFYPSKNGLIPSCRAVVFREGLIDYTLLKMLERQDKALAKSIVNQIADSLTDYQKDPREYHIQRREILEALDRKRQETSKPQQPFGE